jgi:D-aminopeptidase
VGSYIGHGSGDIALAFSTSNQIEHECPRLHRQVSALHEGAMDEAFRAVAEAVEEAVLSSMLHAVTTTGRDGHCARSLAELLDTLEGR